MTIKTVKHLKHYNIMLVYLLLNCITHIYFKVPTLFHKPKLPG